MKDEYDSQTGELLPFPAIGGGGGEQRAHTATAGAGKATRQPRKAPAFNHWGSVTDEKSFYEQRPKGAKPAVVPFLNTSAAYVPVSFVAKDWNVTPRRIRALLAEGRLAGRLQDNGYWEVQFPYSFTFGTRGPSLKRQQRPKKRLNNVVRIAE